MIWIAKIEQSPLTDGVKPGTEGRAWMFSVGATAGELSGGVQISHGWRYTEMEDGVARLYPPRAVGKGKVWAPVTTDDEFRAKVKEAVAAEVAKFTQTPLEIEENKVLARLLADDALHGGDWATAWVAVKDAQPRTPEQAAYRICIRFLMTVEAARRNRPAAVVEAA